LKLKLRTKRRNEIAKKVSVNLDQISNLISNFTTCFKSSVIQVSSSNTGVLEQDLYNNYLIQNFQFFELFWIVTQSSSPRNVRGRVKLTEVPDRRSPNTT